MNTITIVILTAIALAGFPLGLLLRHLTKEELNQGKVWFKLIILVCILVLIASFFLFEKETLVLLCTSFIFIILLTLPSAIKFKKKKERGKSDNK